MADKLVQDQVTWAQEIEELYATRSKLSVTFTQLEETQKKLMSAEDIIGDIRKRVTVSGLTDLGPKWVKFSPNGTNPGIFQITSP